MFLAVVFASDTTCDMNLHFSCVDGALVFSLDAQPTAIYNFSKVDET